MTSCLNKISKPHIVDLLRIFDKRKTISPRIRYASVRSKPELIKDLVKHFDCTESDDIVYFEPLCPTMDAPKIKYDLGPTFSMGLRWTFRRRVENSRSFRYFTARFF